MWDRFKKVCKKVKDKVVDIGLRIGAFFVGIAILASFMFSKDKKEKCCYE